MSVMKNTGVAWIGEIPSEWKLGRVKYGFDRKKEKSTETDPVVLSLARAGVKVRDISTNEGQLAASYEGYNLVEPHDLLLNPMDLISGANCSISYVSGVISPAYMNLRAKNGFEPRYYDYFFKTQYWCMALFAHGKGVSFDNRWTMNESSLRDYFIPIPLFEEQQAISDYLDVKCSQIDEIITESKASIEEYKELKQAVIFEAVTKGLDKAVPLKYSGIEWLPYLPEHWNVRRIAAIYDESKETGRDDLPILLVSIHSGISDREINDDERERKVIRSEDKTIYKVVHKNYLAYNMMRAWQGGFGASLVDGLVSPAYVVAKPKINVNSSYIENVLRTPNAIEHIRGLSYGVADFRLRLYWPYFKTIRVPLPPIEEQNRIVAYIQNQKMKIDTLISEKQALIEDLQAYKKSLIYEVVTGKRRVV